MFRKRYNRAETEFINAKVNLHSKTETKDQLTEHLCSIIQQNEERKAKKLAELMAKLELADQEQNLETEEKNSEKLKEESLNIPTEMSKDSTILQKETQHKTYAKTLSESDKKSNETNSLKQSCQTAENNNDRKQNVIEKTEPELVKGKEANDVVEET